MTLSGPPHPLAFHRRSWPCVVGVSLAQNEGGLEELKGLLLNCIIQQLMSELSETRSPVLRVARSFGVFHDEEENKKNSTQQWRW